MDFRALISPVVKCKRFFRLGILSIWFLTTGLAILFHSQANSVSASLLQEQIKTRKLKPGKAEEHRLAGKQTHEYTVSLAVGQYAQAVVEQRGVDVVVTAFTPDNQMLIEFDRDSRATGQEMVELVANATGVYRLRLEPRQQNAAQGRYEIRLSPLRAATETERQLQDARLWLTESGNLFRAGKYEAAISPAERAVAVYEKQPDAQSELPRAFDHLANLRRLRSKYSEAETLHRRALALREKSLGAEHLDLAASLNGLAAIHYETGDYSQAETLARRGLAIREKSLGTEHPAIAESLNELGKALTGTPDYVKAEEALQRALAIRERALKPDDPDIATTLNFLGNLYSAKGDEAKAESVRERTLTMRERILPPDHPDLAVARHNRAHHYYSNGEYARAEQMYQQALTVLEHGLGANHLDVAAALDSLAGLY